MLPNFLIIGAMKSGTTSLHAYLSHHPQIFMSREKELRYFVDGGNWDLGPAWYESQFAGSTGAVAIGEASPLYSKFPLHPRAPARIRDLIPDVRLIYLLRHPIERIRSHYQHSMFAGRAKGQIEEVIFKSPDYVLTSLYAFQIEQYLEFFSLEQILLITSEDLKRKREETLRRMFRFLDVDPDWGSPVIDEEFYKTTERRQSRPRPFALWALQAPGYRTLATLAPAPVKTLKRRLTTTSFVPGWGAIPDNLRLQLEQVLRPDVRRLRSYIGSDFDGWGIA